MTRHANARVARPVVVVAAVALMAFAASRLDLRVAAREITRADPWWLAAAFASNLVIVPLWAAQWVMLAGPGASAGAVARVVAVTSTLMNGASLAAGGAASIVLLVRRAALSKGRALAVLAMDQLLVGVVKVGLVLLVAAVATLPHWMRGAFITFAGLVAGWLALLVGIAAGGARLRSAAARLRPHVVFETLGETGSALAAYRGQERAVGGALLLAVLKKVCELAGIIAVQRAFGVHLPVEAALIVLAALVMGTAVPVLPGNAGLYEAAVVAGYAVVGIPAERALGMAVVQHAAVLAALTIPGLLMMRFASAKPTPSAEPRSAPRR
jgi:uncharacterized membrane protein YbhN (UPF0104 family)